MSFYSKKEVIIVNKKEFNFDFLGRNITVEIGNLAKQADGSALVRYGDTVVLTAAVMNDNESNFDFPLQIIYNEKLYSVGKIPGGFIKEKEDLVIMQPSSKIN